MKDYDPETNPYDPVTNPYHYVCSEAKCQECGQTIECIDITQHSNFCIGNAQKYLWRVNHKGDPIENLRKALWYIAREIERRTERSGNPERSE